MEKKIEMILKAACIICMALPVIVTLYLFITSIDAEPFVLSSICIVIGSIPEMILSKFKE